MPEPVDLEVLVQPAPAPGPGRAGRPRLGPTTKVALAGVAVGLAISVGMAWSRSGPARVVSVISDFRLVVLDGDGHERRLLASDVSVTRGLPRLAIAPDRRTAYLDRARPSRPGECPVPGQGVDDVMAVPLAGDGPPRPISRGRSPAVSADGRYLAFVRPSDCVSTNDVLVVHDLRSGRERTWTVPHTDDSDQEVFEPSWAPGSRRLAFVWVNESGAYPWLLDIGAVGLRQAVRQEQSNGLAWHGYFGSTGAFLGASIPGVDDLSRPRIVVFSPTTGFTTRTLFDVGDGAQSVVSDRTGSHVLVIEPSEVLARWDAGSPQARPIARHVIAAAWLG